MPYKIKSYNTNCSCIAHEFLWHCMSCVTLNSSFHIKNSKLQQDVKEMSKLSCWDLFSHFSHSNSNIINCIILLATHRNVYDG